VSPSIPNNLWSSWNPVKGTKLRTTLQLILVWLDLHHRCSVRDKDLIQGGRGEEGAVVGVSGRGGKEELGEGIGG